MPDILQPTLDSGSVVRSKNKKKLYDNNFVLDIDTQQMSTRQHRYRVGNFYNNLIQKSILKTNEPTPLLSPEKAHIMNTYRKAALG